MLFETPSMVFSWIGCHSKDTFSNNRKNMKKINIAPIICFQQPYRERFQTPQDASDSHCQSNITGTLPLQYHSDVGSVLHGAGHRGPLGADLKRRRGKHGPRGWPKWASSNMASSFLYGFLKKKNAIYDFGWCFLLRKSLRCSFLFVRLYIVSPSVPHLLPNASQGWAPPAAAMVARPSFSKVPPMKQATEMAFPKAVRVTVSRGGLAGLSSLAGTPSKNDLPPPFPPARSGSEVTQKEDIQSTGDFWH